MEHLYIYIGLAAAFGLFMAWGIGANDVANAMATSIGSGALTIRQALLVAAVFEFAGAVLLITLLQLIPRSISKPVKELTEAATLMSKGDLNQQINPSHIKEFKTLSETLERMRMSQKTLIDRMLNKA